MIQSGTGQFENIKYHYDGKTVVLSQTITFPKSFNNTPVIVVNMLGAGLNFSAGGFSVGNGLFIDHFLKSYKLASTDVKEKNFKVILEALPIDVPKINKFPVSISGVLIEFSWIAYNEVTIGA